MRNVSEFAVLTNACRLQVSEVVLDFLRTEFPEARTARAFDAFVAE